MRIAVASDHAGVELRERVKKYIAEHFPKDEVRDFGAPDATPVDYPDYGGPAARAVAAGECDRAVLVCGAGIGMSIVANKVSGVRAALCTNEYMARMGRAHNDANVLVLPERVVGPALADEILRTFLTAEFEGGRHARRIGKIAAMEQTLRGSEDE
jgi:ribose 5-phosphate isomerase B